MNPKTPEDISRDLSALLMRRDTLSQREQDWAFMCDQRGVENPCPECIGWGVRAYPSTAGWRGGIGGQTITSGVCDRCWGSGDEVRRGSNLRAIDAEFERLRSALLAAVEMLARIRLQGDRCECGDMAADAIAELRAAGVEV